MDKGGSGSCAVADCDITGIEIQVMFSKLTLIKPTCIGFGEKMLNSGTNKLK